MAALVATDLIGRCADGINNMDPSKRESAINTFALTNGFLPINPFLIPLQFGLLIVALIILIMAAPSSLTWGYTFLLAYITQALITAAIVRSAAHVALGAASGL